MTKKKVNVLFGTQEYTIQAGGVGSVTVGLSQALVKKGFNVYIVTPFFDAYYDFYENKEIEHITSVRHIYKGKQFRSDILHVLVDILDGQPLYHYLIRPEKNSSVAWLFNIEKNGANIYQSFTWSEAHNRREYFNSAVAAMLRVADPKLPTFDIYHSHTWHTGLAGILAKEMENLPKWQEILLTYKDNPKKIPYMVSTVHMLLDTEHGQLTNKETIRNLLFSVGLPSDLAKVIQAGNDT